MGLLQAFKSFRLLKRCRGRSTVFILLLLSLPLAETPRVRAPYERFLRLFNFFADLPSRDDHSMYRNICVCINAHLHVRMQI